MQKGQKGSCFQVQLWVRVSTAKAMRTVTSPVLAPGSGSSWSSWWSLIYHQNAYYAT